MLDPFNDDTLSNIFMTSRGSPNRLHSRENSQLEFKEAFSFSSLTQYYKTFAAFSNAKGGYIIFGIKDKPRELIGLKTDQFDNMDAATISKHLNEYFDPEIQWDFHIHSIGTMQFGIIYIYECNRKPVICRKTHDGGKHLKEGSVYYRYRGQSTAIKYGELRAILDDQKKKEQVQWLKHIKKIASVGVQNVSILDQQTGEITGNGINFILSEDQLHRIKFIKEGELSKTDGAPTLKLIGTAHPTNTSNSANIKEKTISRGVRTDEIIYNFLDNIHPDNPLDFIRQICFESSGTLPLFYYVALSKINIKDCIEYVKTIPSSTGAKDTVIKRLQSMPCYSIPKTANKTILGKDRTFVYQATTNNSLCFSSNEDDAILYLRGVRMMQADEISDTTLKNLKTIFDLYHSSKSSTANEIRLALCHVDNMLYEPLT